MATEKIGRIVMLEKSMTQQSAREECDINCIVERAKRGEDLSRFQRPNPPVYSDLIDFPDYREALVMVTKAREMFMGLDAFVRERFANDPARMLDFLADDANYDEAVKLGLVVPKAKDTPLESNVKGDGKGVDDQSRGADGRFSGGFDKATVSGSNREKPKGDSE